MNDDMTMEELEEWKRGMNKVARNIVELYEDAVILYVPMPVFSEEEFLRLSKEAQEKTDFIIDFNIDLDGNMQ